MRGCIPADVELLTGLTIFFLYLGGNEFGGTILTQFGGLSLWGNRLTNSIPSEMTSLTRIILKAIELDPELRPLLKW